MKEDIKKDNLELKKASLLDIVLDFAGKLHLTEEDVQAWAEAQDELERLQNQPINYPK